MHLTEDMHLKTRVYGIQNTMRRKVKLVKSVLVWKYSPRAMGNGRGGSRKMQWGC